MTKYKAFSIIFILFFGFTFAQNMEPKFEKQNDLTKATYFYENGDVKEIGYFKNEKLQGKWVSYNQKGKITAIANYENGIKEGMWYINTDGAVKELTYQSNKLIKVKDLDKTELSLL